MEQCQKKTVCEYIRDFLNPFYALGTNGHCELLSEFPPCSRSRLIRSEKGGISVYNNVL